jgi:Flp pilus assembly protein TadD
VYVRRGDDARARVALERALAIDAAQVPHGHEALAILYLRSGDTARADSLARLDTTGESDCLRLFMAGMQARLNGDLVSARDSLEAAARRPAAQSAMFVELGNVEYEIGNLDAAEQAFEHALRMEPEVGAALNGLAAVQRGRGHLEAAVASFARLAARRPQDGAAQFNLAGTSMAAAQRVGTGARADSFYTMAENAFGACIAAGFRLDEARQQRAHLRLRRGDNHGAMEDARPLLASGACASAGRLLMARAALAAGDAPQTVALLAPSFRSDSLSTDALFILGQAYLRLDRHAEAAAAFQRAHDRQPDDWRTSMNLGVALSKSGQLEAAEAVLRALATARPRDPDVLQNLAAVLQKRGRRSEADRLVRQADKLRGNTVRR